MNEMTTEKIDALIKKQYGVSEICVPGELVANEERLVIPLSPKLNIILNGGIPEGTWITFTGKPKSGKTTLALHFAAKVQRPEYGGREVYYLDIERRLKKMNLVGTPGLNLNKFHVIRSTKEKILSAQDFLMLAEHILRTMPHVLIIIDSYSALCHSAEQSADVGTPVLGMGSYTLLAQFCRQMSQVVPVMESNVLGITHIMANIGAMGHASKTTEKGGNAIVYQGDIKLKAKFHSPWKLGSTDNARQIGQIVSWSCEFSALGSPGQEIESYIRYGRGIDELYELISCGLDLGIVEKNGSWYIINDQKVQGAENVHRFFLENPKLAKELEDKVYSTMRGE
jgi:recombination protein RecA